jgi:SNF2 family DNA or RNA helicase
MKLKIFIIAIFHIFKSKNRKYPTLEEVSLIFDNPERLDKDLVSIKKLLQEDEDSKLTTSFKIITLYNEVLKEFEDQKDYSNESYGSKDKGKEVIQSKSFTKLTSYQIDLLNRIKLELSKYNEKIEIKEKDNSMSLFIKDGEPNTYLAYFALDKKKELYLNYRVKQTKSLPFNKVLVSNSQINEVFKILDNIINNQDIVIPKTSFKERIKSNDKFDEYVTETKGLLSHQKAGSILAEKYNRFAFFYDTGTGKTIMALEIMKNKYQKNKTKFLAIVPKPIIKTAWMEDSSKFFPYMKVLPLSKNIKSLDYVKLYNEWNRIDVTGSYIDIDEEMELGIKKIPREKLNFIIKDLKRRAQHFIINMDLFRDKDASEELMKELKFTGIILDESALIKNYDSQSARRMRVLSKKDQIKYFYLLSGKPAPNNDAEYFSQMKIIDPETFHMTRNDFLDEFFTLNKFNKPTAKQSKSKMLAKMVSNRSLVISKEDCLDLPKTTNIVNSVELDTESFKKYASMYQNFVTEVESIVAEGKKVKANSNLASIMKLRQIANGFILDENHIPYQIHDKKISRLEEILEEIGSNQVVIWHNFDYELEMISKLLNKMGKTFVTANGNTKNLDENIKSFKDNKVDVIVANLKTLKYGVTLVNSHYAVYYSVSYSYEDYYQSQARNHRYGQEHECTYFFILSEDTIDINIYNTLIGKESRNNFFESLLKDATKYGVDYKRIKDLIRKNRENLDLSKN